MAAHGLEHNMLYRFRFFQVLFHDARRHAADMRGRVLRPAMFACFEGHFELNFSCTVFIKRDASRPPK